MLGLQVKYAVGEAERLGLPSSSGGGAAAGVDQAKLFVGSLPRDVKEEDVSHRSFTTRVCAQECIYL